MRSLKTTLAQGLAAALIGLFIVLEITGGYAIRRLVEDHVADQIGHTVTALLAGLAFDEQGVPTLANARVMPVFEQPYSGHYYRVQSGEHVIRSRSLWDRTLPTAAVEPGRVVRSRIEGPQGQVLLVVTGGYRKQGYDIVVSVAEDFAPILGRIRILQWSFALLGLVALAIAIWLQWVLIGRGLAPLERLREEVQSLKRGETRAVGADAPKEVVPLVTEINRLTELTAQRLKRSRSALGNVAHAVKTPLTVLTQLSEHHDLTDRPDLSAELSKQTGLIRERIDRELKRARIAGASAPGRQVRVAEQVHDLVTTLEKIYHEKSIQVLSDIEDDLLFHGDRDDVLELLGNLMDNASKWADQRVQVSAGRAEGDLMITVEDDGPGLSTEQLDRLARHGGRVDESREGHGLGLAIAGDIVAQYHGRIEFGRSDTLGGLRVELRFPEPNGAD